MATPFGGHPTFQQYLEWLRAQGFTYRSGVIPSGSSIMTTIRIFSPKGTRLLDVPDIGMNERLAPSQVDLFDNRLGVNSPFPKTPK